MLLGLRAELRRWTGTTTSPPCLRAGKACAACCLFLSKLERGLLPCLLLPAQHNFIQATYCPTC